MHWLINLSVNCEQHASTPRGAKKPVCKTAYYRGAPSDSSGKYTVELWSLELACLEHQGSLELVRRSRQTPYTFNVKIHPWLEQRWLELSNSKHGPQGDFSCKTAMTARTKYFFTRISHTLDLSSLLFP